ncbi:CBS domain-containing protein [Candidatus Sumerlaeota bacterium]|nr:CBS domain-containing protein [Candidatus Sumerlaeota bacterium]
MSIRNLVKRDPITVPPQMSVLDAIKIMAEHRVGAVAITEGRKLKGIFTERDVMKKIVLAGLDPGKTPISNVMTKEVKKAHGSISVTDALGVMNQNQFRHLPIVNDQDEIEGMVSLRYILYDLMDDLKSHASSLESYLGYDGPGG